MLGEFHHIHLILSLDGFEGVIYIFLIEIISIIPCNNNDTFFIDLHIAISHLEIEYSILSDTRVNVHLGLNR